MEPQIRYCTTSDGVNIAYSVTGSGPLLLSAPDLPHCHVALEWEGQMGAYLGQLAAEFTLVRFDARGLGLSDRDVSDFSFEARMRDLEAVVEGVGQSRLALMGNEWSGPLTIAYAARHSASVTHLILWDTFARSADYMAHPLTKISMELLDRDWDMFVESRGSLARGIGDDAFQSSEWVEFYKACITRETDRLLRAQLAEDDVTVLLPAVEAPTLILHHTGTRTRPIEMARRLAAGIRGSRLVTLEGGVMGQWSRIVSQVANFVKGDAPAAQAGGSAVILFTDIVDSTALTERLGDTRFREASRALDVGLRDAIHEAGGAAIGGKLLGDGVLATFPSAAQAIDGARRCLALSAASELGLHIGLHAGDVIREENNVFGGAVNIAARICALSAPGEILVSDVVRGMARSSAGVEFADRGEQEMKGVGEPVRVYAVRWRE
ncbi:MAG: adenylate/guanylate cyclase domain-containing protein [Dehalococcoidia bacterium]